MEKNICWSQDQKTPGVVGKYPQLTGEYRYPTTILDICSHCTELE